MIHIITWSVVAQPAIDSLVVTFGTTDRHSLFPRISNLSTCLHTIGRWSLTCISRINFVFIHFVGSDVLGIISIGSFVGGGVGVQI